MQDQSITQVTHTHGLEDLIEKTRAYIHGMRPAKYTVDGGAQGMREVFRRVSLPPMQRA